MISPVFDVKSSNLYHTICTCIFFPIQSLNSLVVMKALIRVLVVYAVLKVIAKILLVLPIVGCFGKGFVILKKGLGDVGKSFDLFDNVLGDW